MPHGFELLREGYIPELNSWARLYRHTRTGAELLSMENDDENKVFAITFRTPPPDSTGLPHILEHSVLCGSRKYPVKEPFVELVKGSLATFVNAFTAPDKTAYPVASQNVRDLYNLIDVYLDAVFYPRLTRHIFQQEGWHYELEEPDQPLRYKGVVFNEMKGAYSSPDMLLRRHSQRGLFPDTPYGFDSGGDPTEMPQLTYEQFRAFHRRYYHPTNALIFFYGDDDPEERLRYLDAQLRAFEPVEVNWQVPLQPRFDAPRRLKVPFDASGEGAGGAGSEEREGAGAEEAAVGGRAHTGRRRGFVTVNWLLTEHEDPETTLGLVILEEALVGTPASPLRKALIDSGLGDDLAGVGLELGLRQMYFSTGLKGIAIENADRVEALILDTLSRLATDGLGEGTVAAALNTVEFRLRENNTGRFPRGLALMLRALSRWAYGGDPLVALAFEAPLEAIKSRVAGGDGYFEGLIRRFLVENPHRTTVLLKPDPRIRRQLEEAERQRLAEARAAMSDQEVRAVIDNTRQLQQLQVAPDPPEALAAIPSLRLEDLDRQGKTIPLEVLQEGRILYHDLPTNGILYLDVSFDLHSLGQELLPWVPLAGQALVKMGTEAEDYVRLSQRIGRTTGGIEPTLLVSAVREGAPTGDATSAARLVLRGKATVDHAPDLLAILRDILLTVRLDDHERFRQLVLESRAQLETSIVPAGHQVARTRLGAQFGEAGWLAEVLEGPSQLFFVRQLVEQLEADWPSVQAALEEVRRRLVNQEGLILNVTVDQDSWTGLERPLEEFAASLPEAPAVAAEWSPERPPSYEGLTIPARVNYVAKGARLYDHGYRLHGSVAVITNYLRTRWLWERIRVQGGAYGAFCTFDQLSGLFAFGSYRDPNLLRTLENYDAAGEFLRRLELSAEELVRSIIGAIGAIDRHLLPDAKGYTSMVRYLTGETDQLRQQFREEVLGTQSQHFRAFAEVLDAVRDHGRVVVIGSQEVIEEANAAHGGWLVVEQLL